MGEEKSCAGHREMSSILLPLRVAVLLSRAALQWWCLVGSGGKCLVESGRTWADGSSGSAGLMGQAGGGLAVDKLLQGSLRWTRLCFGQAECSTQPLNTHSGVWGCCVHMHDLVPLACPWLGWALWAVTWGLFILFRSCFGLAHVPPLSYMCPCTALSLFGETSRCITSAGQV